MKVSLSIQWLIIAVISTLLISCERNDTVFYEDDDAENLSVFSDKGNNLMSCYVNDQPFRTNDRLVRAGFAGPIFDTEVGLSVFRDTSLTGSDTLNIVWWRRDSSLIVPTTIGLVLAVKKAFFYDDFNLLNGERIAVDGVHSYFLVNGNRSEKGTGSIYFHKASFILPTSTQEASGKFSGIFEATLPSYKITRGRFDHSLNWQIINF